MNDPLKSQMSAYEQQMISLQIAAGCPRAERKHADCKNMRESYGDMNGERYRCEVCGDSYYLDYDEMR